MFVQRPSLPKYCMTWDTQVVLDYLRSLFPLRKLSLLLLSKKLVMLLVLLSGQRGQSIHLLNTNDVECTKNSLVLRFNHVLKTSKPGRQLSECVLPALGDTPQLCVVTTYKAYVVRTAGLRTSNKRLFISTISPYGPISRDSVRNWTKSIMKEAGVDLSIFGGHSTRAAATSKASTKGVALQTIIKTAGWTREQTFRKFYDKPISRDVSFAQALV